MPSASCPASARSGPGTPALLISSSASASAAKRAGASPASQLASAALSARSTAPAPAAPEIELQARRRDGARGPGQACPLPSSSTAKRGTQAAGVSVMMAFIVYCSTEADFAARGRCSPAPGRQSPMQGFALHGAHGPTPRLPAGNPSAPRGDGMLPAPPSLVGILQQQQFHPGARPRSLPIISSGEIPPSSRSGRLSQRAALSPRRNTSRASRVRRAMRASSGRRRAPPPAGS